MHRALLILFATGLLVFVAPAQPTPPTPPHRSPVQEVRAVIDSLFDAMRAGDGVAARSLFHEEARLQTALGTTDTSSVRTTSVEAFVEAVERPHEQVWDERIWDVQIRVDGALATAWVPYAFYLGNELSHCGVNAVHLVRTRGGWKILQLIDTRRQDCSVPEGVQK